MIKKNFVQLFGFEKGYIQSVNNNKIKLSAHVFASQ